MNGRGVVNEFTTDLAQTCLKPVSLLAIGFIRGQEQTDMPFDSNRLTIRQEQIDMPFWRTYCHLIWATKNRAELVQPE